MATPFEHFASKATLSVLEVAFKVDPDRSSSWSWVAGLTLAPPFSARIGMRRRTPPNVLSQREPSFQTEVLLEDRDGVARTLLSLRKVSIEGEKTGASAEASWLSFGGTKDLSERFNAKGGAGLKDLRLDLAEQAILGIGKQLEDPLSNGRRNTIISTRPLFLPYRGFDAGQNVLGYCLSLGLVDPPRITLARKHTNQLGNQVVDIWVGRFLGVDADPAVRKAAELETMKMVYTNLEDKLPLTGKEPLGTFLANHHVLGTELCPLTEGFEQWPAKPQDAQLPMTFTEDLFFTSSLLGGQHEDGRSFVLCSFWIPGLPVWVLASQYSNETYPRLAFFVHNLVGTTRDGKTVSWIKIPRLQVAFDPASPALTMKLLSDEEAAAKDEDGNTVESNSPNGMLLRTLEKHFPDWKKELFESSLSRSEVDFEDLLSGVTARPTTYHLRSAVNAVRQ